MNELSLDQLIWQLVAAIPEGNVASYGQIAKLAGFPNHSRYVGRTLKNLPNDSNLPWHRVVNSQGKISFPENSPNYEEQRKRLENEGLVFIKGKVNIKAHNWQP